MKHIIWAVLLIILIFACAPPIEESGVDPFKEREDTQDEDSVEEESESDELEVIEETEEVQEEPQEEPEEENELPETPQIGIVLSAQIIGSNVQLTWNQYSGEFKAYKVTRSIIHSNPQYPEESLLKTLPYIDQTTFLDETPEEGISYYVVTALGPLNQKTHSNPVSVEMPDPDETPDQEIALSAEKTDQGILLTWTRYEGEFLQYKIVKSQDHLFPKYPDDKLIKTIPYRNTTTFLDIKPETGLNVYAVTIIRPDNTKFTSTRVSITT